MCFIENKNQSFTFIIFAVTLLLTALSLSTIIHIPSIGTEILKKDKEILKANCTLTPVSSKGRARFPKIREQEKIDSAVRTFIEQPYRGINIDYMITPEEDINAGSFHDIGATTDSRKKNTLILISEGAVAKLPAEELGALLGHELGHVEDFISNKGLIISQPHYKIDKRALKFTRPMYLLRILVKARRELFECASRQTFHIALSRSEGRKNLLGSIDERIKKLAHTQNAQ